MAPQAYRVSALATCLLSFLTIPAHGVWPHWPPCPSLKISRSRPLLSISWLVISLNIDICRASAIISIWSLNKVHFFKEAFPDYPLLIVPPAPSARSFHLPFLFHLSSYHYLTQHSRLVCLFSPNLVP